MGPRSSGRARGPLEDASREFARWRRRRRRGTRIPVDLWALAVEAAREHGVSRTSLSLGLDYYALKQRLEEPPAAKEREAAFVEMPLVALPTPAACVLEFESAGGSRLRIELREGAASEVETVVRALRETGR